MIVCIAEKPSVARDIAHIIGARESRDGYMEGGGYQVTWTYGHLCTLKEPGDYGGQWQHWSLGSLPMIPDRFGIKLIDADHIKKQFKIIERLMRNADSIINCGDAGQEGELIQRWVMQKAGAKCPVRRLWINSLTEDAIREGFASLKDQKEYESLYLAGLSRSIGDWLLGMNATRLYTVKYGQNRQVLSVGRVQTPTLALIVSRQREIASFVPRQSWTLSTLYRETKFTSIGRDEDAEAEDAAAVAKAQAEGRKLKPKGPIYRPVEYATEAEGQAVLAAIKDNPLTVLSVQRKKGTEAPPHLYDLTSLQVACNNKFSYSAEQTLSLIQSLYEKKVATYPRVDTTYLPDDVYHKCPQIMNGLYQTAFAGQTPYAALVKPLGGKPLKKSKKVFDTSKVTDHHAIIPTGQVPRGLSDMERNVFDLIARAFIAAFYPDCAYEQTTVTAEVPRTGDEAVMFRTTCRVTTDEGWKVVFRHVGGGLSSQREQTGDSGSRVLDSTPHTVGFKKGESGPHTPSLTEKWTQPPKPYTEATLLRAMETAGRFVDDEELRAAMKENGIGRPSSRANIIETLFKRHYIKRERKTLVATQTGCDLIDIIREELLKSCELTGLWEKKLRDIEHHRYSAAQFIDELKQQATDIVNQVLADNTPRRIGEPADDHKSAADTHKVGKSRGASRSVKVGDTCPLCGKGTIIQGHAALGCSRWREGCKFRQTINP